MGIQANYHLNVASPTQPDDRQTCSLLKLHGSANWATCTGCGTAFIVPGKITEHPADFRSLRCGACGDDPVHILLIPPSWDKSEYRELLKRVWAKAIEELSAATRICIIGYSLPEVDAFFKYLLTLALSENHRLYKLIVVDYGPDAMEVLATTRNRSPVEERYRSLLDPLFQERRFSFHPEGFVSFLANHQTCLDLGRGEMISGNFRQV